MTWLNTTIDFPLRRACLIIGRRDSYFRGVLDALKKETDPVRVEARLREIIDRERPDLVGCTLVWMQFSFSRAEWEIGIEHPSLEPVAQCAECPRQPLVRESSEPSVIMLPGGVDPEVARRLIASTRTDAPGTAYDFMKEFMKDRTNETSQQIREAGTRAGWVAAEQELLAAIDKPPKTQERLALEYDLRAALSSALGSNLDLCIGARTDATLKHGLAMHRGGRDQYWVVKFICDGK